MKLQLRHLFFEVGDGFTMAPPWNDPALQATHGVYVTHEASGLALHVRASDRAGDAAALLERLRSQQWGEPPFDVVTRRVAPIEIVAGTFRMRGMEPRFDRVREWYVSDGRRGAEAALVCSQSTEPQVILACEQLVDSLRFT